MNFARWLTQAFAAHALVSFWADSSRAVVLSGALGSRLVFSRWSACMMFLSEKVIPRLKKLLTFCLGESRGPPWLPFMFRLCKRVEG